MTESRARDVLALVRVIDETRALFHRLKLTAQELHDQGDQSASRRGILSSLAGGPKTVPQLARARPVSRQHIQMLVNPLEAEGLVERIANPRHKRSKLVRLTPAGRQALEAIERRERPVLESLAGMLRGSGIAARELEQAGSTLAALTALLASPQVQNLTRRKEA